MLNIGFDVLLQGRRHRGAPRGPWTPHFFEKQKEKNGNKGKEERDSKQKLLKCCPQGQNVTVLVILERLEFKKFSCRPPIFLFHGPSTLKSISPALSTVFVK